MAKKSQGFSLVENELLKRFMSLFIKKLEPKVQYITDTVYKRIFAN